jgi:hypothetical protein
LNGKGYSRRSAIVAVTIGVLLTLVVIVPRAVALTALSTEHAGWLGYAPDYDGVVHGVAPGSPAARAGLRAGDRFDLAATPIAMRRFAVNQLDVAPETPVTLAVRDAGTVRMVTLHAAEGPVPSADALALQIAQFLADIVGLAIALVILARRPGALAWLLLLYALSVPAAQDQTLFGGLPWEAYLALSLVISDVLGGFGPAALVLFALRFPDDALPPERRRPAAAAVVLGIVLCGLWMTADVLTIVPAVGAKAIQTAYPVVALLAVAGTAVALFAGLRNEEGAVRRRLHWLIVAIVLLPLVQRVAYFLFAVAPGAYMAVQRPIGFAWLAAEVLGWAAIGYGVLQYRVVSLRFVADRALVYGTLTALLVAAFAVAHWFVAETLESAELVPAVSLGLALVFAFSFHALEERLGDFVESIFFAARHRAEQRLARSASMIAFASRVPAVADLLVTEPVDVLQLESAALFLRAGGRYTRVAARGWAAGTATMLDAEDPLLLALHAEPSAKRLEELRPSPTIFPDGAERPVLIVPIVVRRALLGVALYGEHAGGGWLDPDSISALERLAAAAGPTLVHLMLRRARRGERRLREELGALRADLVKAMEELALLKGQVQNGVMHEQRPVYADE